MKRQRKQYSAELKAKLALEAIKGQRTIQEIGSQYRVHPNLVTNWKRQLLDSAAEIFSNGRAREAQGDEELRSELYQQIGNAYVGAHEYERAYKAFDVGVDPFSSKSTIEELYQLWSAARLAGRTKQAQVLLQYLQLRVPHDDPVWAQRLHDELGKLQAAGGHETVHRQ